MPLIDVALLSKEFRQPDHRPGLRGSLVHLVRPRYVTKRAVDRVSFAIEPGECVAYVGANGSGKSTTIKMLCGVLVPTSGRVTVAGVVPHQHRIINARHIGVVFGHRTQLWWDLAVTESLALLRDIYAIPEPIYRRRLDELVALLELSDFLSLTARRLSLGQRMRADLAAALLHAPRILYLDEPTIGLDVAVKARLRGFLRDMNAREGTTIVLTTHDLADIEAVARRILIIDHGRLVFDGGLDALKDRFARERTIHFQLRNPAQAAPAARRLLAELPDVMVSGEGSGLAVRFDRLRVAAGDIIARLVVELEVVDFRVDEPSIEQVVIRLHQGELSLTRPGEP
jgi:ABC-2 type transport system ATP-binding protein